VATRLWVDTNVLVHFADAYLAAVGAESGLSVASFDRDLDRFSDVRRFRVGDEM
jgi:predicted nucleic acid-binding protein